MFIRQISVFLENKTGTLRELTQILGENGINLLAISIADTAGFGIVRCIVKEADIDRTMTILRDGGYIAKENHVICVAMPHRPLGLCRVLQILEENGVDVEYSYSLCRTSVTDAVLIIRPSDKDRCVKAFEENGVRMLSQKEVDEF